MDAASYAYTEHGFKTAMAELKNESEAAWEWLSKIPKHTWARHAMDMNCKTDLVVNNLSEVFNKWVLDVRAKPIRTMVDGIRTKLMVKFNANRTKTETVRWEICPTYAEKLEEAKKFARNCHALMAGPNLYQVTSGERTYAVNLQHRTCGCKKWDMTAVPCNHAVSAIHKAKLQPEDFVHDFFKKRCIWQLTVPLYILYLDLICGQGQTVWTLRLQFSKNTREGHRLRGERANMRSQLPKTPQEWPQLPALIAKRLAIDTPTVMLL